MRTAVLVRKIQRIREDAELPNQQPASREAIAEASKQFHSISGHFLPEAYQKLLAASNGLTEDGLILWPCEASEGFKESIITANQHFKENVSEDHLFFGQHDDSVFAMELSTGRYIAMELNGLSEWRTFNSCQLMIEYMLEMVSGE